MDNSRTGTRPVSRGRPPVSPALRSGATRRRSKQQSPSLRPNALPGGLGHSAAQAKDRTLDGGPDGAGGSSDDSGGPAPRRRTSGGHMPPGATSPLHQPRPQSVSTSADGSALVQQLGRRSHGVAVSSSPTSSYPGPFSALTPGYGVYQRKARMARSASAEDPHYVQPVHISPPAASTFGRGESDESESDDASVPGFSASSGPRISVSRSSARGAPVPGGQRRWSQPRSRRSSTPASGCSVDATSSGGHKRAADPGRQGLMAALLNTTRPGSRTGTGGLSPTQDAEPAARVAPSRRQMQATLKAKARRTGTHYRTTANPRVRRSKGGTTKASRPPSPLLGADSAAVTFGPTSMGEEWEQDGAGTRSVVLQRWLDSYATEEGDFNSNVLRLNSMLCKARVFSEPLGYPNRLLVAVAFHILGHTSKLYSRYSELMDDVRVILQDAVYLDEEHSRKLAAEGADNVGYLPVGKELGDAAAAIAGYYENRIPFFRRTQALDRERDQLLQLTTDLHLTISDIEERLKAARAAVGGRKWSVLISKAKLKNVEHSEWDFLPTLQAVSKIHQNLANWRKQTRNPVDVLLNMFKQELGPEQQVQVHHTLIKLCPREHHDALLQLLMQVMRHDAVAIGVRGWIDDTAHDDLDELGEMMTWILSSNSMAQAANSDASWRPYFLLRAVRDVLSDEERQELAAQLAPELAERKPDVINLTAGPKWDMSKGDTHSERIIVTDGPMRHVLVKTEVVVDRTASKPGSSGKEDDTEYETGEFQSHDVRRDRRGSRASRRSSVGSATGGTGQDTSERAYKTAADYLVPLPTFEAETQTSPRLLDGAVEEYMRAGGGRGSPYGRGEGAYTSGRRGSDAGWGDRDRRRGSTGSWVSGYGDDGHGSPHGGGHDGGHGGGRRGRRGSRGSGSGANGRGGEGGRHNNGDFKASGSDADDAAGRGRRRGSRGRYGDGDADGGASPRGRRGSYGRGGLGRDGRDGAHGAGSEQHGAGGRDGGGRASSHGSTQFREGRGRDASGAERDSERRGRDRHGRSTDRQDYSPHGSRGRGSPLGRGRRTRSPHGSRSPRGGRSPRGSRSPRGGRSPRGSRSPHGGRSPRGSYRDGGRDEARRGGAHRGRSGAGGGAGAGASDSTGRHGSGSAEDDAEFMDSMNQLSVRERWYLTELVRRMQPDDWDEVAGQLKTGNGFHMYVPGEDEAQEERAAARAAARAKTAADKEPARPMFNLSHTGYSTRTLEAKVAKRRQVFIPCSWERFGKKPKRGIKKKRVRLQHVLHLVFGCYDNKIVADQADDAVMRAGGSFVTQRQPMPDFVYDFLMNKFGLASIAESNLRGIIECIKKKKALSGRLRLFGTLCGVLEPEKYNPRAGDVVLHLYRRLFPKFSAATLRGKKEHECFVLQSIAKDAVLHVFQEGLTDINVETAELSQALMRELLEKVDNLGMPYSKALVQVAEARKSARLINKRRRRNSYSKPTASQAKMIAAKEQAKEEQGVASKDFQLAEVVVDVDKLINFCVELFLRQCDEDNINLVRLYHEYDVDKDGVLSVHEFGTLIQSITKEHLTQKDKLALFNQARKLQNYKGNKKSQQPGPMTRASTGMTSASAASDASGAADGAADGPVDVLLAEEFALMCVLNGITPSKGTAVHAPKRQRSRIPGTLAEVDEGSDDEAKGAEDSDGSGGEDEVDVATVTADADLELGAGGTA